MSTIDDIEPRRLYSLKEAAALIPSGTGRPIAIATARAYVKDGRLVAQRREIGKKPRLFVWGAEILRFLQADTCPVWNGRTKAEADRAYRRAQKRARELGI
jgi:hypothetical protein